MKILINICRGVIITLLLALSFKTEAQTSVPYDSDDLNNCMDNFKPNAGPDIAICSSNNTIDLGMAPANHQWLITNIAPNNATVNPRTGFVSGMTEIGTYRFRLISLAGCADTVSVFRTAPKLMPLASQSICEGGVFAIKTTLMNDKSGTIPNYQWYNNNGYSNPVNTLLPEQNSAQFTALPKNEGIYKYKVVVSNGGCKDSTSVTLTINASPILTIGAITCSADLKTYSVAFKSNGKVTASKGIVSESIITGIPSGQTVLLTATNSTNCITTTKVTKDCGIISKGSLGDCVWKDVNNDGLQNGAEAGVKDIVIELYKDGKYFAKDTTDEVGYFYFNNLDAGKYKIKVVESSIPSGCIISTKHNILTNDEIDSDIDPITGESEEYMIEPISSPFRKDLTSVDAAIELIDPLCVPLCLPLKATKIN